MATNAQVDAQGVFLSQVLVVDAADTLPHIRLADAPTFGQALMLSRQQIITTLRTNFPGGFTDNWGGAEQVRVTRRVRALTETELKEKLTAILQQEYVRDRGELELRLPRAWSPVAIPDDEFTLRILDLPTLGVSANFIARFELRTARETLGSWQVPLVAKVWKEIWVARGALVRGQSLPEADVVRERRDVLGLREAVLDTPALDDTMEIAQSIPAGAPLAMRSLRLRPVVRRGQVVEAQLKDGSVLISLKVEVLEEGAPGAVVRVRNPQTRREFRGKVHDEQTVLVTL